MRADVNGDGQYTIADVAPWLANAFFFPGDWLIWALATYVSPVAELFGIGTADYGGVLSGFLSAVTWLVILMGAGIAYAAARDADRAVTNGAARLYGEVRRRLRVAAALFRSRLSRRPPAAERGGGSVEFSDDIELSDDEWRALRLCGELQPGYALALSECAAALELRRDEARKVLSRLKVLGLLDTTIGGHEGENAYTLTKTGRGALVFRLMS